MHIVIVSDYYPPDRIGGVGEIAARLRDEYVALGHRVSVVTTGRSRADEPSAGIHRGASRLTLGVFTNNWLLWRILQRDPADLVHLHQSSTTLWLLARRWLRVPPRVMSSLQVSYVGEAREIRSLRIGDRTFRPRRWEWIEKFLFAPVHILLDAIGYLGSDIVTVVSHDNHGEISRTVGRFAGRVVHVVPNGAPAALPAGPPPPAAITAGLDGRIVLGTVGVFRTRKRLPFLLLAFAQCAARHPNAVLLVVGGGRGYEAEYRALATALGIGHRVIFAGAQPVSVTLQLVRRMDIFAMLSSYEGMPVALLEAMRAGAAVVATDAYGMKDALCADDPDALVPPDDLAAAVARLDALLADPQRRQRAADAARRAADRLSWNQVAQRYLALVSPP